ncbi:GNAT family N-acetyltransferase [Spirosoma sp. HMF3257]|uniref:RimJ/RimL family protein N-acetyltransferase n=1 Tax=Spirosoma telluris TaxID=2183553 RepID=A0A327NI79_9BACT|nr:GNAT family N-acetyltransferase [Spirosoma telluris]RAI74867.1 RimJ/RimL family protein N-acetyltransferase [Spirosoma telluris]
MLETERLLLDKLTVEDAPFMLELLNTPLWLKFIGDRGVRTLDDARQYILNGAIKSYEQHGFGPFLVKVKDNGVPIGMCGLFKRDTLEDMDIGFAFLPDSIGKGYGFEAATAVMTYARNGLGATRIIGITNPDNQNSIHLLEKLGFSFERTVHLSAGDEVLLFGTSIVSL